MSGDIKKVIDDVRIRKFAVDFGVKVFSCYLDFKSSVLNRKNFLHWRYTVKIFDSIFDTKVWHEYIVSLRKGKEKYGKEFWE